MVVEPCNWFHLEDGGLTRGWKVNPALILVGGSPQKSNVGVLRHQEEGEPQGGFVRSTRLWRQTQEQWAPGRGRGAQAVRRSVAKREHQRVPSGRMTLTFLRQEGASKRATTRTVGRHGEGGRWVGCAGPG